MERESWGIFHDGTIHSVNGVVPGTVLVRIEIPYLRQMFPGAGEGFVVSLKGCSRMSFVPYEEPALTALAAIAAQQPEILYVNAAEPLEIGCTMGTLFMDYESAAVALDSGESVTNAELEAACERYWKRWEEESKQ